MRQTVALQSGSFDVFVAEAEVTSLGGLSQTVPPRRQDKAAQVKEPLNRFTRQYRCVECHIMGGQGITLQVSMIGDV